MSATEELRRMLDERGVKWSDVFAAMNRSKFTHFVPKDQMQVDVWERDGEFVIQVTAVMDLIPEQVIAATLGNDGVGRTNDGVAERKNAIPTNPHATCVVLEGENPPEEVLYHGPNEVTHYLPERTCHDTQTFWYCGLCQCSNCAYVFPYKVAQETLNEQCETVRFCPHCGARVVE